MDHFEHMMDWWGVTNIGWYMMIGIWAIFIVIAILIALDADRRGMNSTIWFLIIVIPMIGIFSVIVYLILRDNYPIEQRYYEDRRYQKEKQNNNLNDVLKTLDERYAKGEITREEYLQMKMDIESRR